MKLLNKIQQELKAPKAQFNSFGKYNYRSCEDILEAVKPLLGHGVLLLTDEVVNVGNFNYVRATAILRDGEDSIEVSAYARESEGKKGMDDSQMTGTASSYARKYALNGLFAIDDTKDADTMDNTSKPIKEAKKPNVDLSDMHKFDHDDGFSGEQKCDKCGSRLTKGKDGKMYCVPCWKDKKGLN